MGLSIGRTEKTQIWRDYSMWHHPDWVFSHVRVASKTIWKYTLWTMTDGSACRDLSRQLRPLQPVSMSIALTGKLSASELHNKKTSWWNSGQPLMSLGTVLMSTMDIISKLIQKCESSENTIKDLEMALEKRNDKLQKLVATIGELKVATDENECRMEMQRNELEEQRAILQEVYTAALQVAGSGTCKYMRHSPLLCEKSQEYWVLYKHRRNLVVITKPFIEDIIFAAWKAGLVSENIHLYATKYSNQGNTCSDIFFKALQVKVREMPQALNEFLQIMQEKLRGSESCQHLRTTMLNELTYKTQ